MVLATLIYYDFRDSEHETIYYVMPSTCFLIAPLLLTCTTKIALIISNVSWSFSLFVRLSLLQHLYLYCVCLSVCLFVCRSVCLFVCLFVCLVCFLLFGSLHLSLFLSLFLWLPSPSYISPFSSILPKTTFLTHLHKGARSLAIPLQQWRVWPFETKGERDHQGRNS